MSRWGFLPQIANRNVIGILDYGCAGWWQRETGQVEDKRTGVETAPLGDTSSVVC